MKLIFVLLFMVATLSSSFAAKIPVTIDYEQVELREVLQNLAKMIHRNVILSPKITGDVTLSVHDADANDLFQTLIHTHGLFKMQQGEMLYIAPRNEIIKLQQDFQHFLKIKNANTSLLPQILIDAKIISVDYDCERELGFNFNYINVQSEKHDFPIYKFEGTFLDVKLRALERAGRAELLSSPHLLTANGQMASIESGEEVPYQEVSEGGIPSFTFKKAVLALKVTPLVMSDQKILLKLQINQDRPNNRIILGMPSITTRQIMTNILVSSGETLVLGGIYENNIEKNDTVIPFISKIPLIGMIFKQKNYKYNKRELLIFVTPKVVL